MIAIELILNIVLLGVSCKRSDLTELVAMVAFIYSFTMFFMGCWLTFKNFGNNMIRTDFSFAALLIQFALSIVWLVIVCRSGPSKDHRYNEGGGEEYFLKDEPHIQVIAPTEQDFSQSIRDSISDYDPE